MNPPAWLNPGRWVIYLALAGALVAGYFWWADRIGDVREAEVRAEWDAEKLMAQEALRQREKAMSIANQGVDREIQAEKTRRVAAERLADQRLRDYQAASNSARDTTPASGADGPHRAIADQCAAALVRLDQYAQSVAGTARGLQNYAGKVCVNPP